MSTKFPSSRFMTRSLALLLGLMSSRTSAVLQTAQIDVYLGDYPASKSSPSYTLLASQASFGAYPEMIGESPEGNPAWELVLPPDDNPLLCLNITSNAAAMKDNTVLLVPRGTCTFETKALHAQQLGAMGIIIHGSLASRYGYNESTSQTQWPLEYYDYDCSKGRTMIPKSSLSFDPVPYNSEINDAMLSGRSNSCSSDATCPSQACLLTGRNATSSSSSGGDTMEACCAWDLSIFLYSDNGHKDDDLAATVKIPAAYLTMQQANDLLRDMKAYSTIQIVLSERWRSDYNTSSYVIWALGVAVAAAAAYLSAGDYHYVIRQHIKRQSSRSANSNPASDSSQPPVRPSIQAEDSMELTAAHALGFIVMASSSLLILFYFKIYGIVKLMYGLGCSKAVSQVLLDPLVAQAQKRLQVRNKVVWRTGTEDFGDITVRDVASHVIGYTFGLTWLYFAFMVRHPDTITFYWVMQDVFGACMCVMFLQTIRLNSVRVATILLLVAFFYDIFFVFVTPLLFKGKSVMITVATSGGPPTADPMWCERYPDDANCRGGDPLPMLFTIPRINDYQGGSSLLGLGDIVLPGLLISFGARFDAAKSLLGILGGGNGLLNSYASCPERKYCFHCSVCSGGYFLPLVISYAVGLAMANAAVYWMQMGQPALLYLVPCCLGTLTFMGWRRQELKDLWDGPKAIRAVDNIIYGEMEAPPPTTGHEPLPSSDDDGGLETPMVPSAQEDLDR
ncbi:hypothetical protein MPSEU_000245500 [Mayamaea pseudoterrestris]|nr:hypothetical protein MPSEU_000245500 [Mayamaea pseudoterrestris]